MKVEMLMPQMGESIAEATVLKWRKSVGDNVRKDETILEISTDKVDSEIPAPATGTITEILAKEGQTVAVKTVVAVIETEASGANTESAPKKKKSEEATPTAKTPEPLPTPPPAPAGSGELPAHIGEKFLSPLVRSLASQHGVSAEELASIQGSGAQGRLNKDNLLQYVQSRGQQASSAVTTSASFSALPSPLPAPLPAPPPAQNIESPADGIRIEPMDNMRKKIAEHMVRSKATSPHVYTVAEVDITNIATWRGKVQRDFLNREGFKLSFTPFFLEAAAQALAHFPYVNASVEGDNILLKKNVHLGCAVALGTTGLIVPVIRNADTLTLAGIARALNDLALRARNKKLSPQDIQGGTFTVTNPGTFGSVIGYPIISQPQVAILSVGAIKKRPVVIDGMIAIRDIVYLTLSYDHRIIDGSMGGTFLQHIVKHLENWDVSRETA